MFEEVDQLKKELEDLRPISPEIYQLISQKLREEWIYNSNALEGNTMSLHETAFFLREGLTIKGKTLREHLEVINHSEAIGFLEDELKKNPLSERFIKDIHAILFQGVKPEKGEESHKIASIHPFSDGNGRVSRICMNFILMKHGYPPAIIRKEERIDYLRALTDADNGNKKPFLELITKEVENSLKVMIGIIK